MVVEVAAGRVVVTAARSVRTVVEEVVVAGVGVSTTVVHDVRMTGVTTASANEAINVFILAIRAGLSLQPYA